MDINTTSYCFRELQHLKIIYSYSETQRNLLIMSSRAFYLTREVMYHMKLSNSRSIIYSLTISPIFARHHSRISARLNTIPAKVAFQPLFAEDTDMLKYSTIYFIKYRRKVHVFDTTVFSYFLSFIMCAQGNKVIVIKMILNAASSIWL